MIEVPSFVDIAAAAERLAGVVRTTPLLQSEALDALVGGRVLLKAELLQHTGSFKFRGAYNAISRSEAAAVVAYSSGNHAQGVARAARLLGRQATIVMPADAPAIKIESTRAHGAEVRLYNRNSESREAIGAELAASTGAALIKPYDDPLIIAGQGTAGLEIAEQARGLGLVPDAALIPCGGGGLTAGCSLALAELCPGIELFTVEPEGFDDTRRSLAGGARQSNPADGRSICDALLAPCPGEVTFEINRRLLAGGLAAGDDAAVRAMAFAFRHLKLVVEPGGAIALAALLAGAFEARGRTVAVMLSGGNVDPDVFAAALRQPPAG